MNVDKLINEFEESVKKDDWCKYKFIGFLLKKGIKLSQEEMEKLFEYPKLITLNTEILYNFFETNDINDLIFHKDKLRKIIQRK